MENIRVITVES